MPATPAANACTHPACPVPAPRPTRASSSQVACHIFAWSFIGLNSKGWFFLIWQAFEDVGGPTAGELGGGEDGGGSGLAIGGSGGSGGSGGGGGGGGDGGIGASAEHPTDPLVDKGEKAPAALRDSGGDDADGGGGGGGGGGLPMEAAGLPFLPPVPSSDLPMRSPRWWVMPWGFAAVELICLCGKRTTLMATLTDGTYGRIERSSLMRVHVVAAVAMWAMGSVQLLGKSMRRTRPKLHRALGAIFLLDWMLLVSPTSFYLSLVILGDSLLGTLSSPPSPPPICCSHFWLVCLSK